ncbi:MAG: hypothetical protein R8G33_04065 [Gammaproteobacteria bacterium]|nr:hypothetical protein [Gammaproteobacteria bacterium]
MKQSKISLLSIIGIITICTTPIFSNASAEDESKQVEATKYTTDCNLPEAFMNAENMAETVADPAKFMQLITLMSAPQSAQMMMNCSTDSEQWGKWTKNLGDPTFKMNAAAIFMNPQVYMNWMTAMMNPQTFMTSMNTFMNPALYMQWMTAMSNPAYYQPMYKMMDPAWQQQSTAWMMDPASYQQMFNSFMPGQVVADVKVN